MAKLERRRGMFFGSWTGNPVSEYAYTTVMTGSVIAAVVAATFGTEVGGESGDYLFSYAGGSWMYNGATVDLSDYGVTVTGSPESGDKFTVTYIPASSGWEALGKDNEDVSKELNPDVESQKNVLGETTVKHSGYEPEIDIDPYYMDPGRIMYSHLLECALEEKYSENDLLGYFAEAFFTSVNESAQTMSGYCYVSRAWFVPQSVGGDTAGYAIPFKVIPTGAKTKKAISYNMATNQATITALA